MPDDAADLAAIKQTIYAPGLDVSYANKSVLIGKLPGGPLQYLHKLFTPADGVSQEVENVLEFPIPRSYATFFSLSDGATLFDNTLFLYGISGAETREISTDNVRPISLIEQIAIQRKIDPERDWFEVGSLAAATATYSLQMNQSGTTALCNQNGQRREYPTFLSMLLVLVQILDSNCGKQGLLDPSAETLQKEIDSFICTARQ